MGLPSNLRSSGLGRSGLNTRMVTGSPCIPGFDATGDRERSSGFGCKDLDLSPGAD